tara:strand:- start:1108 stop:1347 length:240 start_codon:yes stop_codon:yes gene_type:complete
MYSIFDLFFDNLPYAPVYVISDSEMKELKKTQHQQELDGINHQRETLEQAYKAQVSHLLEREKVLRKELKTLKPAKRNT